MCVIFFLVFVRTYSVKHIRDELVEHLRAIMSFTRYMFLRRRSAYKLLLLALIAYITYLSVAVFGKLSSQVQLDGVEPADFKIDSLRVDDAFGANMPGELAHPVNRRANNKPTDTKKHQNQENHPERPVIAEEDAFDAQDAMRRARRLIELKDNVKNYDKIRNNGHMAKGLVIDTKKLGVREKELFDEGWSKYAFNEYASTLIPINRTLPDIRLAG